MSWKNIVTAAALAGSMIAGGAAASYRNNESNFEPAYRALASESRESSSYRTYIQSYMRGLQRNYGDLLPRNHSLRFAFNSETSDHQLFSEAMELYGAAMQSYMAKYSSNRKDSEERQYHLVPHISYDGSVHFTDMNGHGKLKLVKNANGLYSYTGPEKLFEVMGGRGLASTFVQNMEDNDFFHSKKTA